MFSIEQMRLCGQTASVYVKREQNAYEITVKTETGAQCGNGAKGSVFVLTRQKGIDRAQRLNFMNGLIAHIESFL